MRRRSEIELFERDIYIVYVITLLVFTTSEKNVQEYSYLLTYSSNNKQSNGLGEVCDFHNHLVEQGVVCDC